MPGLGKKSVSLLEHGDSDDAHECILEAFPQLRGAGGYELLRVSDRGRGVEVIPYSPDGYSAIYLKGVQQAKVYIRLIQKDLSTDPISSNVVIVGCL